METFGSRVRKCRAQQFLSQNELAKLVCLFGNKKSIARTSITQWEIGTVTNIEAHNLIRLAKALKTTPEYLLYGEKPKTHLGYLEKWVKQQLTKIRNRGENRAESSLNEETLYKEFLRQIKLLKTQVNI